MTFQESIQARMYVSSAVLFESTKKDWWSNSTPGTGYVKSVRIRPYDRHGDYGEPQEFDHTHPEFSEMIEVARRCSHGMRFMEEEITEDNLETFSRTVLASPWCKEPMEEIRRAIKLIDNRKAAMLEKKRKDQVTKEMQAILDAHGIDIDAAEYMATKK